MTKSLQTTLQVTLVQTDLTIALSDLNLNTITTIEAGKQFNVWAKLTRPDTGEGIRGKTVVVHYTYPDGTVTTYPLADAADLFGPDTNPGLYGRTFTAIGGGTHSFQTEFAGDETYLGCEW